MSDRLLRLIDRDRANLRRLVTEHRQLIDAVMQSEPSLIEREGLATVLHSFYGGAEAIFRSVNSLRGEDVAKSNSWHSELLLAMKRATAQHPALLEPELMEQLRRYMAFRHRFRNLYGFELDWELMRPLLRDLESTHTKFDAALGTFLSRSPEQKSE